MAEESDTLPYPPQEAVEAHITLTDRLAYVLEHYDEPLDFQQYIDNCLTAIHGNSSIAFFSKYTAQSLERTFVAKIESASDDINFVEAFSAGSLLGIDTATVDLPEGVSKFLHQNWDMEDWIDPDSDDEASALLSRLSELHKWGYEAGDRKLIDRASMMYFPKANDSNRFSFSLGFRFGVETVCWIIEKSEV